MPRYRRLFWLTCKLPSCDIRFQGLPTQPYCSNSCKRKADRLAREQRVALKG